MSGNSTGYVMSGAVMDTDDSVTRTLELLHERLTGRTELLKKATGHSKDYIRQMLRGDRAMSLSVFVLSLQIIHRIGVRGSGREFVRRILDALARPFGLTVVPVEDKPVKDVRSEVLDANEACSRAFVTVHESIGDSNVSDSERAQIQASVIRAKSELDDVVKAVTR